MKKYESIIRILIQEMHFKVVSESLVIEKVPMLGDYISVPENMYNQYVDRYKETYGNTEGISTVFKVKHNSHNFEKGQHTIIINCTSQGY